MTMNTELKLSVIVPVYNGEHCLERMVGSILAQKMDGVEIILVDDGSTDRTPEVCDRLAGAHANILALHIENLGVSRARNMGLRIAKGEWICFADSDDEFFPGAFRSFRRRAEQEEPDWIIGGCIREHMASGETVYCGPDKDKIYKIKEIKKFLSGISMEERNWALNYVWNKWYRRDRIEAAQLRFREELSLGEDFVFNTEYAAAAKKTVLLAEPCYHYMVAEGGLVSTFRPEPWKGRSVLYEAHCRMCRRLGLGEKALENAAEQAGRMSFGDIRTINADGCRFDQREKRKFVEGMMKSDQFPLILYFLERQKGLKYRLHRRIFRSGKAERILWIIAMEKKLRH